MTSPTRQTTVRYRRPHGTEWEDEPRHRDGHDRRPGDRDAAADWQDTDANGVVLRRTLGFASLGGATLDNEENYLMKKLYTALGAVEIENQARI